MNSWVNATAVALAGAMLTLLFPSSVYAAYSSAPLKFCNNSSDQVAIAVGYHSPGVNDPDDHSLLTGPFVSLGWRAVQPGECVTSDNPFNARYMFWFAIGPKVNTEYSDVIAMRASAASEHFCITSFFDRGGHGVKAFTFEVENESVEACDQAGGSPDSNGERSTLWISARKLDTWVNPTVNFTGE
jgi:uncharacterized membrane protein